MDKQAKIEAAYMAADAYKVAHAHRVALNKISGPYIPIPKHVVEANPGLVAAIDEAKAEDIRTFDEAFLLAKRAFGPKSPIKYRPQ